MRIWTAAWKIPPPALCSWRKQAPGDVLRVDILDISLDPVGILDMGPASGALKHKISTTVIRGVPVQDNRIHYRNLEIPARPMVGVIGVAPERGASVR